MRFDCVIIGGGLSGLVCGISLQKAGKKCAIVSAGQNSLNFSSGTVGLLSRLSDGTPVDKPLEALSQLGECHPYRKIGIEKLRGYAEGIKFFFAECGVSLNGDVETNGFYLTAVGNYKRAALAMDGITLLKDKNQKIGVKILVVNMEGYLDFNTQFIASGLERNGSKCRIETVNLGSLERIRKSPTEMRALNIARVLDSEKVREQLIDSVKAILKDEDCVVMPAVCGLDREGVDKLISEAIGRKVCFIGTMPPTIPGMRAQMSLKNSFVSAGGTFMMGDQVLRGELKGDRIISVVTANLGDVNLEADNFVLATGSYFARGLSSSPEGINEPVFGLDTDCSSDRNDWYDPQFFNKQNYLGYGVVTDDSFKAVKNGHTLDNLYVTGSILSGMNALYEGCGAGVAIFSAMNAAESILGE